MKRPIHSLRLVYCKIMVLVLLAQPLIAIADVPYPEIPKVPKAKAEQCVEPTDVMRRDHMEFILHQRDETMHRGIRTTKHSLTECISCHVNPGPDGQYPRASSQEHFCTSCHHYASVKIDCFECHADRPESAAPGKLQSGLPMPSPAQVPHSAVTSSSRQQLATEVN